MNRFKHLVDFEEGIKNFRTKYSIPPNVGVRYAAHREWFDDKKIGEVVIPIIAFIEGGMTIPMGTSLETSLDSLGFLPHSVPQTCLGYWGA